MSEAISSTMKAWQVSSTQGGLERNLVLNTSAPLPSNADNLKKDQVLVNVLSAAINPVDYKVLELPLVGRLVVPRPATPGLDFAGRVAATGPLAEGFKPGQLVFGRIKHPTRFGTLADYVVGSTSSLAAVPDGVTADDAASVGTAGLTAYESIVPYVKKGESVFINGGSGGTGIWGIQIAKVVGCYVVTSCSTANVALCKELGADEVIDYREQDVVKTLKESGRTFDLVVDNVGRPGALFYEAHHYLKQGGKYIQVGIGISLSAGLDLIMRRITPGFLGGGRRAFHPLLVQGRSSDLEEIGKWMQQGKVKSVKEEVMGVADAPRAFARLKTQRARGKIVVRMNDEAGDT